MILSVTLHLHEAFEIGTISLHYSCSDIILDWLAQLLN